MLCLPRVITVTLNPAIDRVIEVEGLAPGLHVAGRELLLLPAGKGVNVSRAMATLGVPTVATGFLGAENRAIFERAFRDGLIADEFLTLPGRTRENLTITAPLGAAGSAPVSRASRSRVARASCPRRPLSVHDPRGRDARDTHIRLPGLSVDGAALERLGRKLLRLCRPARRRTGAAPIVIFSGSAPPGMSAGDFAGLVDLCLSAGARIAVDTSGRALSSVAERPLWLVKPNEEELPALVGRPLRGERACLLAARGLGDRISHVVLSLGSRGACVFAREEGLRLRATAPVGPLAVRSTVGCGDALLGAYVAGLAQALPAREAFLRAVAASAASAMTLGPALFDPAVAATLRQSVRSTETD